MTNNKSECCEKCEDKNNYGLDRCQNLTCPCHSHTPHGSEDWSVEDFWWQNGKFETKTEWKNALENFISSKAYQRGREEGEQKLNIMKAACEGACDQDKMLLLSLAVQEIEKEKYVARGHTYASGFNQGLDKAKSIISGLMKK